MTEIETVKNTKLIGISETNFKSACIVVTCATSYTGEARIDKAKILLLGLAIEND